MSKTVKKGRLSTAEVFYIEGNVDAKSVEEIAKDLNRSVPVVQKVVDAIPPKQATPVVPDEQVKTGDPVDDAITGTQYRGPLRSTLMDKMRVRDGRNGKKIGAVMTEAGSIESGKVSVKDGAYVVKDQPKAPNRYTDGSIFKPLGDDSQ